MPNPCLHIQTVPLVCQFGHFLICIYEQATKDQDDQIKFVELETAAIEIKIIDFIVSGEEITFSMLNTKLMVSELKQIEIARILFHWITAQVRFLIDTRF